MVKGTKLEALREQLQFLPEGSRLGRADAIIVVRDFTMDRWLAFVTQKAAAKYLGVSQQAVSLMFGGTCTVPVDIMIGSLATSRVKTSWITAGTDWLRQHALKVG